jgi:hypothetical protein
MDSKLNSDEINALQSLDPIAACRVSNLRDSDLPQRLFAFNLVTRQPSGTTVLTRNGERALFRQACITALVEIECGAVSGPAGGVRKWLLSSGFVEQGTAEGAPLAITRRGQLWLASFKEDDAIVAAELTAADFALRRA